WAAVAVDYGRRVWSARGGVCAWGGRPPDHDRLQRVARRWGDRLPRRDGWGRQRRRRGCGPHPRRPGPQPGRRQPGAGGPDDLGAPVGQVALQALELAAELAGGVAGPEGGPADDT